MANGHGGRRPGSGRKRRETLEEQQTRRDLLLKVISPSKWECIVQQVVEKVEAGDIYAILPYLPYLLGSPKQEINVTGQITHVEMEHARKVLRVVGGTG